MAKLPPRIAHLFISSDAGAPMQEVRRVRAFKALGLEGDRYALGKGSWKRPDGTHSPKRNLTLISIHGIDAANRAFPSTLGRYLPKDTRRNGVVWGMDVNDLIGKEFTIGSLRCKGVEYATPCDRPGKLSGKIGFEQDFFGNAGVNCEILEDGVISTGDEITIITKF